MSFVPAHVPASELDPAWETPVPSTAASLSSSSSHETQQAAENDPKGRRSAGCSNNNNNNNNSAININTANSDSRNSFCSSSSTEETDDTASDDTNSNNHPCGDDQNGDPPQHQQQQQMRLHGRKARREWDPEAKAAFWREKRQERRQRRKQKSNLRREEQRVQWDAMTPQEQEQVRAAAVAVHERRRAQEELLDARCRANLHGTTAAPTIVFDFGFWSTMTLGNQKSTVAQIKFSYSALKRAAFCLRPVLVGLEGVVAMQEQEEQQQDQQRHESLSISSSSSSLPCSGSDSTPSVRTPSATATTDPILKGLVEDQGFRRYPPIMTPLPLLEALRTGTLYGGGAAKGGKSLSDGSSSSPSSAAAAAAATVEEPSNDNDNQNDNVVYLSADSDEELLDLEPSKTYVIGAFVDHNAQKGLTEGWARSAGLRTLKLPLDSRFVALDKICKVLTVNHMVDVLIKFAETKNWKEAFACLPQRRSDH